jgi:ABC-type multidrug transport system fused ATPase/permease subunit
MLLSFFIYCLTIGSVFLQFDSPNPLTGENYTLAEIITVSQCCVISSGQLGQIVPIFPQIAKGLISAQEVFDVIAREPKIKSKPNAVK